MAEKIIFNGRIYHSVAEMSPEARKLYESIIELCVDENQDGVPDLLQRGGLRGIKQAFEFARDLSKIGQGGETWAQENLVAIRITDSQIFVNGRAFDNVDEMPPEVKQIYEQTVNSISLEDVETFDEPWRKVKREAYFTPHEDAMFSSQPVDPSFNDVTEMIDTNTNLIIVIAATCVLCVAIAIWLIVYGAIP